MMRRAASIVVAASSLIVLSLAGSIALGYENFKVAVYSRAYETREMNDVGWIEPRWTELSRQVHVDKIYLETHRDLIVVTDATLDAAKKFFADRGVRTAGGITLTVNERNRFETFCYTNPEHRQKVKEIIEHTARHFDEIILDDFYFTNCKCELCIRAKGDKRWTDYRLDLLARAAKDLILGPAKAVNPRVKVVIKYPNWYEHFQGLGFNLEVEPKIFDGLYTGTETRDPSGNQHLQQYPGYPIFRYFENLKAIEKEFSGWGSRPQAKAEMVIPQIQYLTNDAWEEISAMDETNGWPMLISAGYAKGTLYVLTIPESFTGLYNLSPTILSRIRDTVARELPVRVDGPAMVSLFVYDNGTFIVESFLDECERQRLEAGGRAARPALRRDPLARSRRSGRASRAGLRPTRPHRSEDNLRHADRAALLSRLRVPGAAYGGIHPLSGARPGV